jgi:nucleoside-diphosphate-sugar epimerase
MVLTPGPVAVTGADGFIGAALCAHLAASGVELRRITRASHGDLADAPEELLASTLAGVHAVVHLAGRAHVMAEKAPDPEAAFRRANVTATERLARAAVRAGVAQFVFASSVKVNGEGSAPGRPLRPDDPPAPQDAYARSKLAAERALAGIAAAAPMRVVVLRLPLVYGAGCKGNFRALWDAVAQGRWLPLGAIDNRRSLLALPNAVDAVAAALDAPAGTHFAADAASVSTPALVRAIATAQGKPGNLAFVPVPLLRLAGRFTGRRAAIERLTSSLEVDASSFTAATGWQPRVTLADGVAAILSP